LQNRSAPSSAWTPTPTPHTACLLDHPGREIGSTTVEADPDGYAELLAWAVRTAPGPRLVWTVEGCRSHGAGLLRVLLAAGQTVIEADRPARVGRPPGGKSDPADAWLAARTALAASHPARPRSDGDPEALRILLVTREHANTTRTAAVNVFKSLLLTAPDEFAWSVKQAGPRTLVLDPSGNLDDRVASAAARAGLAVCTPGRHRPPRPAGGWRR